MADRLRAVGPQVFAPTLPGLGERAHLLSRDLTLDACVADVLHQIEAWTHEPIVLVGRSFGGAMVLGVADRAPDRIARLVLLDALVLENGERPFDLMAPETVEARRRAVHEWGRGIAMPVPSVLTFGILDDHPDAAWMSERLTPHPVATYETPLTLRHPAGNGLPCAYLCCTSPV